MADDKQDILFDQIPSRAPADGDKALVTGGDDSAARVNLLSDDRTAAPGLQQQATQDELRAGVGDKVMGIENFLAVFAERLLPGGQRLVGQVPTIAVDGTVTWSFPTGGGGGGGGGDGIDQIARGYRPESISYNPTNRTLTYTIANGSQIQADLTQLAGVGDVEYAADTHRLTITYKDGRANKVIELGTGEVTITTLTLTTGNVLQIGINSQPASSVDLSSLAGGGANGDLTGVSISGNNLTFTARNVPNIVIPLPVSTGGQTPEQVAAAIQTALDAYQPIKDNKAAAETAQNTANAAFNGASFDNVARQLTLTRPVGDDVVVDIPGGGTGESEDDFIEASLNHTTNRLTLVRRSATNPVFLDLSPYVNMTEAEINAALFTKSSRDLGAVAAETFNIEAGSNVLKVLQLGAINGDEATLANGGATVRVSVAPEWRETSESGFPPQVTATILLVRPGRDTIQGTSVHLRGSQAASVSFNLPTSGNQAGDTLQVNFDGADNGNGSNGTVRINSASISEQGLATDAVTALATDAANQVVSPLRNEVAAVEKRSVDNQTKNTEQDTEISELRQRPSYNPSAAAMDLLRRALEVHSVGAPQYLSPFRSLVRWQVGATPPLSLDTDGITVSTPQRRTISGLGDQNDKVYYVKTSVANTDAGGHLIYRVTANGSDEPIFGTVINASGTRVWQAISTDPLDPNLFQTITSPDLPNGVPYQPGDTIGWVFEPLGGGHAQVPIDIIRADGTTVIQCEDAEFRSDNATANFLPDKLAIVSATGGVEHISDVWVGKHSGLGASHEEIAQADPREADLGIRTPGAGRDTLTLSGDIEWTGNSFIVKEGAFKIRKADGTTEVFTQGGEIPTATINAAIAAYLADNPISPTQATVVRRDYDSTILQTAASASLGGNTGLWVVANQQSGTQGIPQANVSGATGVTLPAAVNGIVNLPTASLCRIRSGTDILVMFIPGSNGGGSTLTGAEIVTLLSALSGNARLPHTAIDGLATVASSGSYNDLTDKPTIPTGGDTNSYPIEVWLRVPRGSTVSSSALTSAGVWNNDQDNPGFTTKPTDNVAAGQVFDVSDLPAGYSTSNTLDWHRFERQFVVGESGVPASAWKYLGQANHPVPSPRRYLIKAWLQLAGSDLPTASSLTSAGVWDDATESFTTKPTHGTTGTVYDRTDLPDDASRSTTHGFFEFERYFTVGESSVAATDWTLLGRINPVASGGGATTLEGLSDVNISDPKDGEAIVYRGGEYVNEEISGGGTQTDPVIQAVAYFYTAAGADRPSATGGIYDRDTGTISFTSDQHSTGSTHIAKLPEAFDASRDYWRMTFSIATDESATFLGTDAVLDAVPTAGGGGGSAQVIKEISETRTVTPNQVNNGGTNEVPLGLAAGETLGDGNFTFVVSGSGVQNTTGTLTGAALKAATSANPLRVVGFGIGASATRPLAWIEGNRLLWRNASPNAPAVPIADTASIVNSVTFPVEGTTTFPITIADDIDDTGEASFTNAALVKAELAKILTWTNLNKSASNAGDNAGEVALSAAEIAGVSELAVTYGTAADINSGTDTHTTNNDNKVYATNITLAIIPAYQADDNWMQFGGFGRGADQFIVQAKRTSTGGLTLEAVDANNGTNDYIYSVWAR